MPQVIHIMYGSQTFDRASAKIHLFLMNCDGTDRRKFLRTNKNIVGKGAYLSASSSNISSCGEWYSYNLSIEEGAVIAISSSTSIRGSIHAEGVLLLSLRADGPLLDIHVGVKSPPHGARFKKIRAFTGRADIVNVDDAKDYGIKYTKNILNRFFAKDELGELYSVRELQKGTPAPKVVVVSTGKGKTRRVRVPTARRRKIRLNKY